jgi:hypothetical protein
LPGDSAASIGNTGCVVANSPPDIVLGVALAADPQKYRVAVERLQRMSAERVANAGADPGAFSATVQRARAEGVATPVVVPASTPPRFAAVSPRQMSNPGVAFGQLEAFVLQTFIQSMLPKNAQHVFGKGTAGEVWKSMLAEKLGAEIARSGQLGIAKRLAAGRIELTAAPPTPTAVSLVAPPSDSVGEAVAAQPLLSERS